MSKVTECPFCGMAMLEGKPHPVPMCKGWLERRNMDRDEGMIDDYFREAWENRDKVIAPANGNWIYHLRCITCGKELDYFEYRVFVRKNVFMYGPYCDECAVISVCDCRTCEHARADYVCEKTEMIRADPRNGCIQWKRFKV